jgi:serine/threonine-protein kinase HipA
MSNLTKLIVSLDFGKEEIEVGELARTKDKIYFKYYQSFLNRGFEISPFKIPLADKIYTALKEPFEGLFGVFNDSLPDGWGRLLLDRKLLSQGKSLSDISPLDRLAFVGSSGMGALTYHPKVESSRDIELSLELDEIAKEMNIILEGTDSEMLDELYKMGGSSGGARPKIFIGYNPDNETITYSLTAVPFKENWIIKFPSASDLPDIANIEYAYHQMAIDSGLEMSNCKLFKGKSGKYYFGTKRFDRDGNNRLHLHSACGLMHDNYRLSSMDYGHLMDCAFRLEKHVDAYKKILRLAAFNVFSHNRDDHSKNFSFLMDLTGKWRFAPVYDLTFSYSAYGHHSTMVAGESKSPGKTHLLKLAEHFGVKNANEIIEQVRDVIANWKKYAIEAGVSKASMGKIQIALSAINK